MRNAGCERVDNTDGSGRARKRTLERKGVRTRGCVRGQGGSRNNARRIDGGLDLGGGRAGVGGVLTVEEKRHEQSTATGRG